MPKKTLFEKYEGLEEAVIKFSKEGFGSEKIAELVKEQFDIPNKLSSLARIIRFYTSDNGLSITNQLEDSQEFKDAQKRGIPKSKAYFITSAQNETPVHDVFLKNLEAYAEHRNAEIIVIPIRYKNPTSIFKEKDNDTWDRRIHQYMYANRFKIGNRLTVLADVKMQPTASTPLSSMEGMSRGESAVLGHPRQHFKTLDTLAEHHNKYLFSTGSLTLPNYTDSKAGKKGEFHHTLGFAIVETDWEDELFVRHVSVDDEGNFIDLGTDVVRGEIYEDRNLVAALVGGDIHVGSTDPEVDAVTVSMLERFKPTHYIMHDLMDGYSVNPHEKKDPFIGLEREQDGSWNFEGELDNVKNYVRRFLDYHPVAVSSNHNDFIDRFLMDSDWRKESNKKSYLQYAYLRSQGKLPNGVLPYELEKEFGDKVICLNEDSSFVIAGNELGQHGHIGASGSRGTPKQYKKLNIKTITGHTHSPSLEDGAMVVGTQTYLKLNYNKGMSKWANSNAIVHVNGKRQNLIIENGKYTNF